MIGKNNTPDDTVKANGARRRPGYSALDTDREASMADEGGASGMAVASEEPDVYVDEIVEPGLGFDLALVGGVFVLGALTGLLLGRLFRGD